MGSFVATLSGQISVKLDGTHTEKPMKSITVKFEEEKVNEIERLASKCGKGSATYIRDVISLLLDDPIRESLEESERLMSDILNIADKMNSGRYISEKERMIFESFLRKYDALDDAVRMADILNKLAYKVWIIQDWLKEDAELKKIHTESTIDDETWEDLEDEVFPEIVNLYIT